MIINDIKKLVYNTIQKYDETVRVSTSNNIADILIYIIENSNNAEEVVIMQENIAGAVGLSRSRITELLKLAKNAGLILIHNFTQWNHKEGRNKYKITNNNLSNLIKKYIKINVPETASKRDDRKSVAKAVSVQKKLYEKLGADTEALNIAERNTIDKCDFTKGVESYFEKAFRSAVNLIDKISHNINSTYNNTYKNKADNFNNFEQRKFDDDLEWKLLGWKK
jgi:hypothetical protein